MFLIFNITDPGFSSVDGVWGTCVLVLGCNVVLGVEVVGVETAVAEESGVDEAVVGSVSV